MSEASGEFTAEVGGEVIDRTSGASDGALQERLHIPRARRRSASGDEPLYVLFREELPNIILGVSAAGAACPIVMWAVLILLNIIHAFWVTRPPDEVIFFVLGSAIACAIGAAAAFLYAMFAFVAVYWVVYWFVRSLQMRGKVIWLAAFSGGLAGFVAILPWFLLVLHEAHQAAPPWEVFLVLIVLACPTTVMGQIGGAWGLWRGSSYERSVAAAAVAGTFEAAQGEATEPKVERPVSDKWIQFRIWHLLMLSFWVSLLLTAIRLCGIDVVSGIVLLVAWAIFQAVTLLAGGARVRSWRR